METVYSEDSIHGLSYSIKAGMQEIGEIRESDYVVFLMADQPYLRGSTIVNILDAVCETTEVISAACGEKLGSPKLFSGKFAKELIQLTGDQGGRAVLKNSRIERVEVTSPKELIDIDTKEEWNHIENHLR